MQVCTGSVPGTGGSICKGPGVGVCPVHGRGTVKRPVWWDQGEPEKSGGRGGLRRSWGQAMLKSWCFSLNIQGGGMT